VLELSSVSSRSRENGNTVSVFVGINQIDCFLDGVFSHNYHDWGKDLLVIDWHSWADVVNDGGSEEITFLISWHLDASSIEKNLATIALRG